MLFTRNDFLERYWKMTHFHTLAEEQECALCCPLASITHLMVKIMELFVERLKIKSQCRLQLKTIEQKIETQ